MVQPTWQNESYRIPPRWDSYQKNTELQLPWDAVSGLWKNDQQQIVEGVFSTKMKISSEIPPTGSENY